MVLVALLFGLLAPLAEQERMPEERLTQMIEYKPEEMERWLAGEDRDCGKYFQWSGLPTADRAEVISFKFGTLPVWMALPNILMHQLDVLVVKGEGRPRARRNNPDDANAPLYTVEISEAEFGKATCLTRARRVFRQQ